jgi:hypothetical protein
MVWLASGTTPDSRAITSTPANIAISRAIIQLSVIRALRHSTGLNDGTALEMASIPVMAVEPDANARSTTSTLRACTTARWRAGTRWNPRPAACTRPAITRVAIAAMNAYVGTANTAPA